MIQVSTKRKPTCSEGGKLNQQLWSNVLSTVTESRNMGGESTLASGIQGKLGGKEVMFELSQKLEVAKGRIEREK